MTELPTKEREICLQRDPRAMMSTAILGCVMAVSAILLFLRMYFFNKITQEMSLVISIMSTFVATSETEIEE